MLQNLNQPKLCNRTRLAVKIIMKNLIVATIIIGKFKGKDVLIPTLPPYQLTLLLNLSVSIFRCTLHSQRQLINLQGHSLEVCGINLELPSLVRGQL